MLILQGILNLIFLIFAEKSKTHSNAFEDASYPSHSKNLETNANQHANLEKFWSYYFFKYFLDVTDAKFGKEY